MVRKLVLSFIAVLGLCTFAAAQNTQVSGTVVSADGLPVIGATIMVEGTGIGTSTDGNGKFVISAPVNGILAVSCIGYADQQVPVNNRTALDIVLDENAEAIDDVVVVGYGTGRKVGTVIGSVDQVKSEKLEARPTNNVMDAMQGQVAGLQVVSSSGELNKESTITLHGLGSIQASSEPLILLDGAPITSGNLLAMSPNDIASLTVLKDASATSIYGSRAANGVIYVTSKRGARGEEGAVVTLRTQYSFSNMIRPRLTPMNTEQQLDYLGALTAMQNGKDYTLPENIAEGRQNIIDTYAIDPSVNVDWFDEIMKSNAPLYQVDLSVSGGSQRTSYYFSGSYYDQQGVMPGSTLDRYSFRSNIETKANDWLKMGINLSISYQTASAAVTTPDSADGVYFDSPMMGSMIIPSFQPAYDAEGNPNKWLTIPDFVNPALVDQWMRQTNNRLQFNGSAFVELTPVKGLTLRSQLAANAFDYRARNFLSPDMPKNNEGGTDGDGTVVESFQRMYAWTWTNTAEYKFTVADDHHFTALLGEENIYGHNEAIGNTMKGITNSDLLYLNQGTVPSIPSFVLSKYAYNSVFGRIEYDFLEKYFIDGSVRYDACSRFGEENRGATFWSVGAMWNLSKENFLRNNRTVSDLSLKLSYGTQGNSAIGNYDQYEVIGASNYPYNGQSAWSLTSAGNPKLAWETQGILTVGASATLWRRLTVGVDWYRRQTSDMLMPKPMAPSSGVSSLIWNIGAMRNSGVDVTLNYDIFANKDWYVNFHATFNYNKNQLTELWEPDLKEAAMGPVNYYIVGKPYGEWYMQEWRGVNPETGEPQWTAEDGGVTSDYSQAVPVDLNKSLLAPYSGGFGFNVMWKGIGLTADFSWMAGNYAMNNTIFFTANTYFAAQLRNQSVDALDYWKHPGDVTEYPALQYGSAQQDSHMLEDASFLRLKNIQLSYTLPQSLLANSRFLKGFKVYVGARNLFTITGYNGLDPEIAGNNGVEADVYANMRQWTFGCEFKF